MRCDCGINGDIEMKEKYFNNNEMKIVFIDEKMGIYDIYIIEDWTYYKLEKRIYNALSFDDAYNKFRQPERCRK